MFWAGQDKRVEKTPTKTTRKRIDNFSMKTYVVRDYEANSSEDTPQASQTTSSDLGNILVLVTLYTIQGNLIDYQNM